MMMMVTMVKMMMMHNTHVPVHLHALLGSLQGAQFLEVAEALAHDGALKHDQHAQREQGVVPVGVWWASTWQQQSARATEGEGRS